MCEPCGCLWIPHVHPSTLPASARAWSRYQAEPKLFQAVLRNCMLAYTILIVITATVSYAAFGDATDSMVTLNLPKTGLSISVQVFYSIRLFLTFVRPCACSCPLLHEPSRTR